jgi:polyisoprenoid-binding protein YceI
MKFLVAAPIAVVGLAAMVGVNQTVLRPSAEASAPIEAVALEPTASASTVYAIDSTASEARFVIDEVLRGADYTVVGSTDQVAGEFALDTTDTESAEVSTILINARTLETDDSSRNRALQNFILNTSEYEYISFTPTAISGLPASVTVGESYAAQLTGDLSISGTTREAVFDVNLTPVSDSQLVGTASSTINFADWGLSIPSVPFVASVDEQVRLELDFTANAA